MSSFTTDRISTRLSSERGASFSYALLIMLVCVALSSIILSAATAAAGRYAEQGKMDQRYYSVISAAQLFQDSLESDAVSSFTQESTAQAEARGTEAINWDAASIAWSKPSVTTTDFSDADGNAGKRFCILPKITRFMYFGSNDVPAADASAEGSQGTPAWYGDTFAGDWAGIPQDDDGVKYVDFTYDIKPNSESGIGGASRGDLEVKAVARVRSDKTIEFDFYNADATKNTEAFHLYMLLAADERKETFRSEELGNTVVGSSVSNTITATQSRATTVTWRLQQIVPGRGFVDVEPTS